MKSRWSWTITVTKTTRTSPKITGRRTWYAAHPAANVSFLSHPLQRFHIKWKGYSHLHNTDELYEFLKQYKGIKRVDNYIKNQQQILREVNLGDSEEEESYKIHRERQKEALEKLKVVERVIASRTRTDDLDNTKVVPEYFCKWYNQGYDAATWESESGPYQGPRNALISRRRI